ncbi:hypothetical protein IP84_07005 [beta proteobacterium AAP99]|nr:hypothetical protein IP84_07005 [beta proteobacterium AAP99]
MPRGDRRYLVFRRVAALRATSGFSFILVLVLLALVGLALALIGPRWAHEEQRTRERELIRVGTSYAQAIAAYVEASPGASRSYPLSLEVLLVDDRFVGIRRHLRQIYTDPLRPGQPLELVRGSDGRIRGVFSSAHGRPFMQSTFSAPQVQPIRPAQEYQEWHFIADPRP